MVLIQVGIRGRKEAPPAARHEESRGKDGIPAATKSPGTRRSGGIPPSRRLLSTVLGGGFWILLLLTLVLGFRGPSDQGRLQEQLRSGVELMEAGEAGKARAIFLELTREGDSLLAGAAYHNLALLSLRSSLAAEGPDAREAAREAVDLAEASLRLRPRSPTSAWNLEMALRRLARLESPGTPPSGTVPGRDSLAGQQRPGSPADTEGEGVEPRDDGTDAETGFRLSEAEARRILASFRLLEGNGALEAIRSQMREESRSIRVGRRGPPW